jgi:hypothetical protein
MTESKMSWFIYLFENTSLTLRGSGNYHLAGSVTDPHEGGDVELCVDHPLILGVT